MKELYAGEMPGWTARLLHPVRGGHRLAGGSLGQLGGFDRLKQAAAMQRFKGWSREAA
ncbi:hypothetical protein [Caulobacter endophyticus]|uniref:hypothetical protein n=1 Tax=Caulobacter endophyticus TaxID=2172652 RepID=UPI002410814A|nr:hypothetical protein [Caulobacter endophyticus]MDG2528136.1 hypothetical protein [Caulobacter endophyticus]